MPKTTRKITVTRYLEETITVEVPFDPNGDPEAQLEAEQDRIAKEVDVKEWSMHCSEIESSWEGQPQTVEG